MTTEVLGTTERTPWVPNDSTFAARLALVRWRMGWNVKEAALACGVPGATWRLWEMENAQPRKVVEICRTIAARTGCDYLWLLTGEASRTAAPATAQTIVTDGYPDRAVSHRRPRDRRPAGHATSRRHPDGVTRPVRLTPPIAA